MDARCASVASSRFRSATTAAIKVLITAIVPRNACSKSSDSFDGPSPRPNGPRPRSVAQIASTERRATAVAVSF